MLSGYFLILAMLVLGGVIATVGDRIGTRVGKARLSLFKLRPRDTATVVTILTGTVISAATFGFIFATDKRLGQAIIDFQQTVNQRDEARQELETAQTEKERIETDLKTVQQDQRAAKRLLGSTNESLQTALKERSRAMNERRQAEAEIARIQSTLTQTQDQLGRVSEQAGRLRTDIGQLQAERNQLQAERNQLVTLAEQELKARDQVIQQREQQLQDLEAQQTFLAQNIQRLQEEARNLKEGKIVIQRNQVLAAAVVQMQDPSLARQAVDQLLREANRVASRSLRPGVDSPNTYVVQITEADVEQLIARINDGQAYVVRIFAAENYLLGDPSPVQIFTNVVRNQVVFQRGAVIAATNLNLADLPRDRLNERVQQLLAAANFRARSMGILTDSVQITRVQNYLTFLEQLQGLNQTVNIRIVAADLIYTAGPLKVDLEAEQNGQILLRTEG
jgi:uncharacterized protein (DUF3084 family)